MTPRSPEAQAALRDASAWGAKFYEPQMYAKAQAAFDAAMAAREGNPVRCRSLLAEATEAASSAKEAALLAYEEDVKGRFEASRAKLVEIRADRAFPDEFARLVSGIDATAGLFAARSYWDARLEAYRTLKGMSDLYERVDGLLDWLRDAQIRMESAHQRRPGARRAAMGAHGDEECRTEVSRCPDADAGRRFERSGRFDEGRRSDRRQAAPPPGQDGQARVERATGRRASCFPGTTTRFRVPTPGFSPRLPAASSLASGFGSRR